MWLVGMDNEKVAVWSLRCDLIYRERWQIKQSVQEWTATCRLFRQRLSWAAYVFLYYYAFLFLFFFFSFYFLFALRFSFFFYVRGGKKLKDEGGTQFGLKIWVQIFVSYWMSRSINFGILYKFTDFKSY